MSKYLQALQVTSSSISIIYYKQINDIYFCTIILTVMFSYDLLGCVCRLISTIINYYKLF